MSKEMHPEDNINVSAIKSFLIGSFRAFFYFLSFSSLVISRRKWLLLTGLCAGLFLGMFYYYLAQTRYYRASMMVVGTKVAPKIYAGVLDELNILAKTSSTDKLALQLGVSPATARNILYFETENSMKEPLANDTSTRLNQTFEVIIGIRNNLAADSIQNAIIAYINNLPYLRNLSRIQRLDDSETVAYLESDMVKLDSLKDSYNKYLGNSRAGATISMYHDAVNPATVYEQGLLLIRERDRVRRELYAENDAAVIVDPIKVANTVHSRSLPFLLVILGGGGLFLGYIAGMLGEIRRKVITAPV